MDGSFGKRKRCASMNDDDNRSSIFLPEEVVVEILLRLPLEPLFRFRGISKQWKSIVSDPKFALAYLQRARSCLKSLQLWESLNYDCIQQPVSLNRLRCFEIGSAHLPLLGCIAYQFTKIKGDNGVIVASSNGLILSSAFELRFSEWHGIKKLELRVSNPLTKQSVLLPSLSGPFSSDCVLSFATSHAGGTAAFITYKVVLIKASVPMKRVRGRANVDAGPVNSTIQIFSSDTGNWTSKELLCPGLVFQPGRTKAYTCNGILHWFNTNKWTMVTYDPYRSPHRFGCIQLPHNGSSRMSVVHLGHEDVLKYGEIEIEHHVSDRRIRVWSLVDYDKEEWRLEQMCLISPKDILHSSNRLHRLVPDPWISKLYGHLFEVTLDPSEVMALSNYTSYVNSVIPVALCPWSSPFYGQAGSVDRSTLVVF